MWAGGDCHESQETYARADRPEVARGRSALGRRLVESDLNVPGTAQLGNYLAYPNLRPMPKSWGENTICCEIYGCASKADTHEMRHSGPGSR